MKSLLLLLLSSPSFAFLFGAGKGLVAMRSERTTNIRKTITRNRTNTTRCWMGKYGKNTPKKTKIDKNDILSYERSLITEQGYSYILGSDDTGRGSIAGPLVTATCCIMTLRQEGNALDSALNSAPELPTVKVLPSTASGAVTPASGGDSAALFARVRCVRVAEAMVTDALGGSGRVVRKLLGHAGIPRVP